MKKLYKKGRVHPSVSAIEDHYFSLLPASILTLIAALSPEDKQVLAYLISCSNNNNNKYSSLQNKNTHKDKIGAAGAGKDHSAVFNCDCFRCYTSFWARWDTSPKRQLIHEIIEAYEEELIKKKKLKTPNPKRDRRKINKVCDEHKFADSGSVPEDIVKAEESPDLTNGATGDGGGVDDGAEKDGEAGTEKGTIRRFLSFIGEKVSGVWYMG